MRFLLLVPVLAVPVVAVVAILVALARASHDARAEAASRLEGHRPLLRLAGAALGLLVAGYLVADDTLGLGLLLAGPVAALGLLVGVLVAELVVRPPAGPRRSASLDPRRASHYLPRRLTGAVVGTGVTLLVLSVVTTVLGSTDDLGRRGRWLTVGCSALETASRGPWPGSYYTVPLLLVVGAGVVLGLVVLRTTVARPPLLPDGGHGPAPWRDVDLHRQLEAADHELRAQSARAVVAGLGVLLSLPLAGTAALAASGIGGMAGCAPGWWAAVAVALLGLAAAAVAVLLWCATVLAVGGHRVALPSGTRSR